MVKQLLFTEQILIWNLEEGVAVKMIDNHPDVVLCMSFNTDGSLLATSCKDKKLRIIDPRSGKVLQVSVDILLYYSNLGSFYIYIYCILF